MCGIFAYLAPKSEVLDPQRIEQLKKASSKIKHRGPDNSKFVAVTDRLFFGFHRLAINGLEHESDEPLISSDGTVTLICNGEIYNYKKLIHDYGLPVTTHNDCEVIIYLYQRFGFRKTVELLDGVFACVLYDSKTDDVFIANDPIGVRPLYQGKVDGQGIGNDGWAWASEPVALKDICATYVDFFPPGHCQRFGYEIQNYFHYSWNITKTKPIDIYPQLRRLVEMAVKKRLMGERPIACLLSGGLDSSLISALVAKFMAERGEQLHTFSIGLEGSPDLHYAQKVADHIGSVHHSVVVSQEEFLAAIPEVIQAIQSYDVTTVRASVGNYLIAKYIAENTDFKIIFNGDGSEEINASYFYSRFAPSDYAFYSDNVKLLKEVHKYDVLRSARCIEHFGLECRTPFLDKYLVNFVMSINPIYKRFGPECMFPMEKMLLRNTFQELLPSEVLWRPKTAFSDGVSKKEKSWHQILTEHLDQLVTDEELQHEQKTLSFFEPVVMSKEAYHYRKIYHDHLGYRQDMANLIGTYWMPRFIKATDPSAREIGAC